MHQVKHHVERFAVDVFLARTVKMELRQLVARIAYDQKIPAPRRPVIHPDRRAVVGDVWNRTAFIVESQCRQIRLVRFSDVNGRLLLAPARRVLRIQVRPMIAAPCSFVGPGCSPRRCVLVLRLSLLRLHSCRQQSSRGDRQRQCQTPGHIESEFSAHQGLQLFRERPTIGSILRADQE